MDFSTSTIRALDDTTLHSLYSAARDELKNRETRRVASAGQQFRRGDLITFRDKGGGRVVARIDRINAKSLSCTEFNQVSRSPMVHRIWRVTPTLCLPFAWPSETLERGAMPSKAPSRAPTGAAAMTY